MRESSVFNSLRMKKYKSDEILTLRFTLVILLRPVLRINQNVKTLLDLSHLYSDTFQFIGSLGPIVLYGMEKCFFIPEFTILGPSE